ncbi:head-tail adaptor protein [Psychromarinibacter sp. C21-152]|uniref:Head-tail adaptor protein n=1 Tax=Psychromarinibacter sediminicola TaxID=3033385 RepID=A0AAE3NRW9_9RHOB|nr:head-tail adaptor protein [Psychromarinibacter sediminicola]MDF0600941.1 head-tail adaptor protein [Psychromarinibacter sediminicola]
MRRRPDLSRRLVLEEAVRTPDGAGGYTTVWTPLGELWAEVDGRRGRADEAGALSLAKVVYRITVRGAPVGSPRRPVAGQRLRDGNRRFAVMAVTEYDMRARYLMCFAREDEVMS